MIESGKVFLFFGLAFSVAAIVAAVMEMRRAALGRPGGLGEIAQRSLTASFIMTTASMGVMLYLLQTRAFAVTYVWQHTSTTLPTIYTISALWAGQEGSLLFWVWVLLAFGMITLATQRRRHPDLMPGVVAVLGITAAFFLYVLVAVTPPFAMIWDKFPDAPRGETPLEGFGLNPLLQNPGMAVHPPLLYLGYVGFTIPFAFAIAALVTGRLGADWLRTTRRWSLASWLFLTLGILAGAKWAYVELGWGGYWAWDPVENASIIPWFTATAYIHSVMIEERRGMLRFWNVILVALTFLLCVFGTFLTRSGLISSVHSFAGSDVGKYFAGFLIFTAFASFFLIMHRRKDLAAKHRIESFLSREAAFLFNNVILVSMAFAVLWGTVYPMISEYATGQKATVGPPFFNTVMFPLSLILVFLTGVGPVLAWRRAEPKGLKRHLLIPAAASIVFAAILFALGVRPAMAVAGFALAVFVLLISLFDHGQAAWTRHVKTGESFPIAAWILLRRNGRRYGGYLVHVGVVLLFAGVLGSYYNEEYNAVLAPGERKDLGRVAVTLESIEEIVEPNRDGARAILRIEETGRDPIAAKPEISVFRSGAEEPQQASEVDILSRWNGDLYVSLLAMEEDGRAVLQVKWNALVGWIWAGCGLAVIGSLFALAPPPRKQEAVAPAPASSHALRGVSAAVLVMLCFTSAHAGKLTGPAREITSQLACPCGCAMIVAVCTHQNCGGCEKIESRVSALMAENVSPPEILATIEKEMGKVVLGAPPQRGFDWSAWILPFLALAAAAAFAVKRLRGWRGEETADVAADDAPVDAATGQAIEKLLETQR